MRRRIFNTTLLSLSAILFLSLSVLTQESQFSTVKRVIDGDTIQLDSGERVRYIGVDTPETVDPLKPVQYYGQEAKEFNRKLVEGRRIELSSRGKDQRDRILAYAFLEDGTFVNAELLKHGYARMYDRSEDIEYAQMFRELEQLAKDARLGLWSIEGRLSWLDEQRENMSLEMARMQAQINDLMQRISALEAGGATPDPSESDVGKEPKEIKPEDDEIVYVTKSGKKYHRQGCAFLKKSAIPIKKSDAEKRGFTPCGRCVP